MVPIARFAGAKVSLSWLQASHFAVILENTGTLSFGRPEDKATKPNIVVFVIRKSDVSQGNLLGEGAD